MAFCFICGRRFLSVKSSRLEGSTKASWKITCSSPCRLALGALKRTGKQHWNWKEKPSYFTVHKWVRENKEKPSKCEHCKKVKRLEIANVSGEYKRELNDWKWLCKSCHHQFDIEQHPTDKKTGEFITKKVV